MTGTGAGLAFCQYSRFTFFIWRAQAAIDFINNAFAHAHIYEHTKNYKTLTERSASIAAVVASACSMLSPRASNTAILRCP